MSNPIKMAQEISDEYGLEWGEASILELLSGFIGDGETIRGSLRGFLVSQARREVGLDIRSPLTSSDIERYVSSHGMRCPYQDCGSEDLHVGQSKFRDADEIGQRVHCNSCERAWYDIYTLSDVEEERE